SVLRILPAPIVFMTLSLHDALPIFSERQIFTMNVRGTENVLRAAERAGVRKVVVISSSGVYGVPRSVPCREDHPERPLGAYGESDRKSTRLNSSHEWISYAVFCLNK